MELPDGLAEFMTENSTRLLRAAWLLTGDFGHAEDLVQTALIRCWRRWDKIAESARMAYIQRVLMTTWIASRSRRWNGETPSDFALDMNAAPDVMGETDLRLTLLAALSQLPPRQRATLVLRYFLDLSEADTATALGCSTGSVKTHASRGLAVLRTTPGLGLELLEGGTR